MITGTRTITITDPDVVLPDDYKDGVVTLDLSETIDLRRRTLLWVYPDEHYARRAWEDDVDKYETYEPVRPVSRRFRRLLRRA